jgi:cohesin loading factor subunit SCC2
MIALLAIESVSENGNVIQKQEPMLAHLYQLASSKKSRRLEFISNSIKLFDIDFSACKTQDIDVGLLQFVAENLASLDFKSLDDVMFLIFQANKVISVTGETLIEFIEEYEASADGESLGRPLIAKLSVSIGLLCILVNHIIESYGIDTE